MTTAFDSWQLVRQKQIDRLCREYEDAWYATPPPSLSAFVARVAIDDRGDALRELIATDIELHVAHRSGVPVAAYAEQFPDDTELIGRVYEQVVAEQQGSLPHSGLPGYALPEGMTRIGDYRLLREVGRGGMGVVYEAVQESLGRTVALKVLPVTLANSPERIGRFAREARTIARLHHAASDLFRRDQRRKCSQPLMRRAWIGSSSRKRRRSSANSPAV